MWVLAPGNVAWLVFGPHQQHSNSIMQNQSDTPDSHVWPTRGLTLLQEMWEMRRLVMLTNKIRAKFWQ